MMFHVVTGIICFSFSIHAALKRKGKGNLDLMHADGKTMKTHGWLEASNNIVAKAFCSYNTVQSVVS
jgi:hypothetical protein